MHWLRLPHLPDTASAWLALALAFVLMTTSNFAALWLRDRARLARTRPARPPAACPGGCATFNLRVARRPRPRMPSHTPAPGAGPVPEPGPVYDPYAGEYVERGRRLDEHGRPELPAAGDDA